MCIIVYSPKRIVIRTHTTDHTCSWTENSLLIIDKTRDTGNTFNIHICGCHGHERLKPKTEGSTRLTYTGFHGGLGHLKIKTRVRGGLFIMNR